MQESEQSISYPHSVLTIIRSFASLSRRDEVLAQVKRGFSPNGKSQKGHESLPGKTETKR
eukprot:1964299-Pyramimonas_sp.AAC.1